MEKPVESERPHELKPPNHVRRKMVENLREEELDHELETLKFYARGGASLAEIESLYDIID